MHHISSQQAQIICLSRDYNTVIKIVNELLTSLWASAVTDLNGLGLDESFIIFPSQNYIYTIELACCLLNLKLQ